MHANTEKIPLLLSLVLSLPRDEAGFHISALEQTVTSQGTQNSPWGGGSVPPRGAVRTSGTSGGKRGGRYRWQLVQEGFPLLPSASHSIFHLSTAEGCRVSASLQARSVEQRIPFPTLYSEPARSQQGKQSLELYLVLARSVMQEDAQCFVPGGAAQTGAGLQLLQLGV